MSELNLVPTGGAASVRVTKDAPKQAANGSGTVEITNTIGQFDPAIGWSNIFAMGLGYSATGVKVNPYTALSLPVFAAAVQRITSDIAGLPVLVERFGQAAGWTALPGHPIAKLFRKPNSRQTRFELIQHLVLGYLLAGNGYAAIIFDRDSDAGGRPVQLIPILPISATCTELPNGALSYSVNSKLLVGQVTSRAKERGQTRRLLADEMIHIRDLSMDGGVYGSSRVTLLGEAIGLAIAMQTHAAQEFKNGASFRGIIQLPGNVRVGDQQVANTQAAFSTMQGGLANSGKVPVFHSGATFQKTSMSPEEAALVEQRQFQNEELARLLGVPGSLLGLKDGTGYANFETEMQSYVDKTLLPIINLLEQVFADKLLFDAEQDDLRVRFDTARLLRGDTASRYSNYQMGLLNGFINANFVADQEGLTRPPNGDVYRVMQNTGVAGDPNPMPTSQENKPNEKI